MAISYKNYRKSTMGRWIRKYHFGFLVAVAIFLLGMFVGYKALEFSLRGNQDAINRILTADGIDEAGYVEIGGVRQWLHIRGKSKKNPVLLWIHGGPGQAGSPIAYGFQRPWEEFFTVVQWDQRGAGRSDINADKLKGTMTWKRIVQDGVEVIDYLTQKLQQEKVIVVGQSWGSLVGVGLAARVPGKIYAYIGTGQIINSVDALKVRYKLLLSLAREQGNLELEEKIDKMGPPPKDINTLIEWSAGIGSELVRNGKVFRNISSDLDMLNYLIGSLIQSPTSETSALGKLFQEKHEDLSRQLMKEAALVDLVSYVGYDFKVPMFFMVGSHDWLAPVEQARAYFAQLTAPQKKFYEFVDSAHRVHAEQPGLMLKILLEDIRPLALQDM